MWHLWMGMLLVGKARWFGRVTVDYERVMVNWALSHSEKGDG